MLDPVVIPLVLGPRILDAGCGFGRWGALLTTNYWETHRAKPGIRPSITGCDGYLPNVELARQSGFYTEVIHASVPPLPFPDNSFETVLLLDVIEHVEEMKGMQLIEEAKRVASQRVVLSTPNWPAFRDGHATITGWNDLEAHIQLLGQKNSAQPGILPVWSRMASGRTPLARTVAASWPAFFLRCGSQTHHYRPEQPRILFLRERRRHVAEIRGSARCFVGTGSCSS